MVKSTLYKRTIALGTSIDFRKDMRRSEPRGDSGGSGWRKEAVKTGGMIYNITEKRRDLLYVQPTNPDLHETTWTPKSRLIHSSHRHRIDKYLDTLLANQPISDGEATDHCQKGAPQDGGLPELIVARFCLTIGYAEAGRGRKSPMTCVVCCNAEDLSFGRYAKPAPITH